MGNRKAQISIFILLGLAVLFAALLFFFAKNKLTVFTPDQVVPPEVVPVKTYIDNCLDMSSREAVILAGLQGGYSEVPEQIRNSISYLALDSRVDYGVPYWYYYSGNKIPSLDVIKNNLETTITSTFEACVGDLSAFSEQFDITKTGRTRTKVVLAEKDVSVSLEYPLKIKNKLSTQTTKLKDFNFIVPMRLKHLYNLAKKVLEKENEELFLENRTFDLMVINQKIPVEAVDFTCKRRIDQISEVRYVFQEMLAYNLADFRIKNTRYSEFVPGDKDFAQRHFVWDAGFSPGEAPDVAVDFTYSSSWPLNMYITPNEGSRLRAEPIRVLELLPICYRQYHYTYDIDFPVLVTLSDFETAGHDAFEFQFVTPVLLNHNKPDRKIVPGFFDYEITPTYDTSFCDEFQKKRMIITAHDKVTLEEIDHVNVSASCINYLCPLGEITPRRGTYELIAEVPDCGPVTLIGTKDGFEDGRIEIDTNADYHAEIPLVPLKEFSYYIVKHKLSDPSIPYDLSDSDMVVLTIKNRAYEYTSESVYPAAAEIPLNIIANRDQEYEIEIYLMKNQSIVGGYVANWTAQWFEASGSDTLRFHVFESEAAYTDDDLQFELLLNMSKYSTRVPPPRFI